MESIKTEFKLKDYFCHYPVFKESSIFSGLITEIMDFINKNYTQDNLSKRLAYLSDKSNTRESYGFIVSHSVEQPKLPHLKFREYPMLSVISDSMFQMLDVDCRSRLLFNIQLYRDSSKAVPKHFDGDLYDFSVNTDGTLTIKEAIRPKRVAVLTVINNVLGGGTRLHQGEISEVVPCYPGDLLVFDNIQCEHSVDSFNCCNSSGEIVRLIIGWRSVEESCTYFEDGIIKELSFSNAVDVQEEFLKTRWPHQWKQIVEQNKLAAF